MTNVINRNTNRSSLPLHLTPYRVGLLCITLFSLGVSWISPPWPEELLLQHIPTLLGISLLLWGHQRFNLSNTGYTLIILFLLLHIVGARWIYSYVPYDAWSTWIFGERISDIFGCERNHYDRFVHLCYGLLLFRPVREILQNRWKLRFGLANWFSLEFIMASSMIYELIEWGIAILLSPEQAEAYNGQQGDLWDAQKDMALAICGGLIALLFNRKTTTPHPH